jgi:hypothetical protein
MIRSLVRDVICSVNGRPQPDGDSNGIGGCGYRTLLRPRSRHLRRCMDIAEQEREHHETTEKAHRSNENKMSDGGRERASLGMEVWKSSQKRSVQRSTVRSIAWLGLFPFKRLEFLNECGFVRATPSVIGERLADRNKSQCLAATR